MCWAFRLGVWLGLLAGLAMPVSAALIPGDVAVIAYNSDGTDRFAWVALKTIDANTTINFTDSSWQGTTPGSFRTGEHLGGGGGGPLIWTHGSSVTAGTVIRFNGSTSNTWSLGTRSGTGMTLSANGDQIFAYTGTNAAPNFLYGINFANNGWIAGGVTSNATTTSNIPGTLTSGTTAFHAGNFDNGYYSGLTTGPRYILLDELANQANWTRSNTTLSSSLWATSFTVTSAPEPSAMVLSAMALLVGSMMVWRQRELMRAG